MDKFDFSVLPELITKHLSRQNITIPTPIQEAAIPIALEGHDILASAQTGTGKTAAFAIPAIMKLLEDKENHVLVLTPTREIATQVLKNFMSLLDRSTALKACLVIGGEDMRKQIMELKRGCHIVVGTPGRINDHLRRGSLSLKKTKMMILDETDRMLDMGFGIQIDEILDHMKSDKQTLLFSATIPQEIENIAQKYLNNPQRISVGTANVAAPTIEQKTIEVKESDKYDVLLETIQESTGGSCVIFAKTQFGAEKLALRLEEDGLSVDMLHGGLRQNKRERVIKAFRSERFNVLVATDIAARGLDIPHIRLVINYDLPQVAEDYIHRIGRTGRAGAEGLAVNLVSKADQRKWHSIQVLLNPELKKQRGPSSFGRSSQSSSFSRGSSSQNNNRRQGYDGGERRRVNVLVDKKFSDRKSNSFEQSNSHQTSDRLRSRSESPQRDSEFSRRKPDFQDKREKTFDNQGFKSERKHSDFGNRFERPFSSSNGKTERTDRKRSDFNPRSKSSETEFRSERRKPTTHGFSSQRDRGDDKPRKTFSADSGNKNSRFKRAS